MHCLRLHNKQSSSKHYGALQSPHTKLQFTTIHLGYVHRLSDLYKQRTISETGLFPFSGREDLVKKVMKLNLFIQ
jgi:hypothetical protein